MGGDEIPEVDCYEVLAEVYLYLDLECDESRRSLIEGHLKTCTECLQEYGIEQKVKALVSRCCGSETAPEELRDCLRMRIEEIAADPSFEAGLRDRG
ncbi:MAG: mycothiol system anti-sigma-R factor [Longispora sp.]|nr:mycothiol system anti-sigma-R factor [Longispora sp. (in: high G+C Gram-positive bacteria)]